MGASHRCLERAALVSGSYSVAEWLVTGFLTAVAPVGSEWLSPSVFNDFATLLASRDSRGRTPLELAVESGDLRAVAPLADATRSLVEGCNRMGVGRRQHLCFNFLPTEGDWMRMRERFRGRLDEDTDWVLRSPMAMETVRPSQGDTSVQESPYALERGISPRTTSSTCSGRSSFLHLGHLAKAMLYAAADSRGTQVPHPEPEYIELENWD